MSDGLMEWLKTITVGGVGIWTIVAGVLTVIIRQGPINRKLAQEREGNLLKERAAEMKVMRRTIARLEAEQRADRHTINNLEQCLDALLMMIDLDPAKAKDAAKRVLAMRAAGKEEIAKEKAGIHAAAIRDAEAEDAEETKP